MMERLSIIKELWTFLRVRKKWLLIPIMFFLVLLGFLIVVAEGSVVAPLIYTLF